MGALPPSIAGIPIEYIIFGAVLVMMLVAAPVILSLAGYQGKISKRASRMQQRMKAPKKRRRDTEETRSLRRQEGDASLPLLTSLLAHLPNIALLRDRIDRSGMTMSAERYLSYNLFLFIIAALLFTAFFKLDTLVALLLAVVIGLGLPHMILNFRIARRAKKFLVLFPDAIDLIVRGLRAGLPVTESIKMVAREIEEPVGSVFQLMTEKMALGIPLEKTLYDTARKYRITEFDFFVTSIVLQRETGGNLSEILSNLSEALRQRLMMRLKIKAMSSEAKASMYIISTLPFIVIGALTVTSPDYLLPLINDYRGNIALGIAGGMLGMGVFIMIRMTKFEI